LRLRFVACGWSPATPPCYAGMGEQAGLMARERPAVPASLKLKKKLFREAGFKCANPGCPNRRTHIHHIREWAIFETHDKEHMVAICPSCHDAVHHGSLEITDETVNRWKHTERPAGPVRDYLYVEPGDPIKLLTGTIAIQAPEGVILFALSENNRLRFRVAESEIMILDLQIVSPSGTEIARVVENHIRSDFDGADVLSTPGHVRIDVPADEAYIPPWALKQVRVQEPAFGLGGKVTALELEVLRPGIVRANGIWFEGDNGVVITDHHLMFVKPGLREPVRARTRSCCTSAK
jgi:hypothetical protein